MTAPGLTARARTARKHHRCVTCGHNVQPGEQYVEYTAFPNHDVLGTDAPHRFAECNDCILNRAARRSA